MRDTRARDLAYCGVLGAAALLLPVVFHLISLGSVFMPMYLPLVLLGFYARPVPAAVTAVVTPLLSGAVTGMPPFYPPVAVVMAAELGVTVALVASVRARWPGVNTWVLLAPALVLGRVLNTVLVYGLARVMELPAAFLAGLSLLSGWPGGLLMLAVIPVTVRGGFRRPVHPPAGGSRRAGGADRGESAPMAGAAVEIAAGKTAGTGR
jgi:hypothetical protein